jgi:hypothetical protein
MKIKELLNRKVDLKTLFITGPIDLIYNMFSRKVVKDSKNTSIVYNVRTSQPIVIKSEKIMSQYEKLYGDGEAMIPGFALDSVKYGIR